MKPRKGYDEAQVFGETEQLPVGGYVVKILDVKDEIHDWGETLSIAFDIVEGEYKGFFQKDFDFQTREDKKWRGVYRLRIPDDDAPKEDEWKMRRFKTTITDIEESNPGYHWDWDEKTLKGKMVGAVFNKKEYEIEGRHGFFTNCHSFTTIEKIRSGNFKIPADTLLKNRASTTDHSASNVEFMNIPDGIEEELPF